MRKVVTVLAVLLLGAAFAQGRLNPPNYYLSQLTELKAGEVHSGELTEESGQNFKDGSYLDLYVLYGQEGETVTITAASLEFDTYLSIFDPYGYLLATADDNMYSSDAELTVTLWETGRYLVVVSGFSDYDLGRYTISRGEAPSVGGGSAVEFDVPGTFSGTYDANTSVIVPYLDAPGVGFVVTLDEPTALAIYARSWDFDTFILVTDEWGNLLTENDDENYSEATDWNTDSLAFAEFPAGTYYIYVSSLYAEPFGDYTVTIRPFAALD